MPKNRAGKKECNSSKDLTEIQWIKLAKLVNSYRDVQYVR